MQVETMLFRQYDINPSLAEHDICPVFASSVDPDQLASEKPTDLDLHCLSLNM